MNINQLETFIYVVQLKSIHKAAKALFLSQPTVTARIKMLESELNTELFARQGRGLLLTERGKEFIPYAESIIKTLEDGKKMMKKRDEKKEIVIGANALTSQYFIPFALPLWKELNPLLHIKFISASNDELYKKLVRKKVDLAFMSAMTNDGLQKLKMIDNSVRLVVYPNHPLQNEKTISVNQLAEEALVFYECGAYDWKRILKLFEVGKVEPWIEFQVNHLEVAKSIIKNRYAIGFLPYLSVKEELESGELIEIDVTHLIQIEQHVFLTYENPGITGSLIWKQIEDSVKLFNLVKESHS